MDIISKALDALSLGLERTTHMPFDRSVADCGGSRSSTHVLRVLTLLLGLCPSLLLRKSFTLCCILFYVIWTRAFFLRINPSDALNKDSDKTH